MHILLIHQAFAELGEAGGTRHHEFARYIQSRGHQVTVIAGQLSYLTGAAVDPRQGTTRSTDDLGVEIIRCASYGGWHTSFFHRVFNFVSFMWTSFRAALRVERVDLVWGTTPPIFQALTASWVARLKRVPFVLEVRDLWPYFAVEVGVLRNPLLIWMSERLERHLYRRAEILIVNSPGFEEHVRSRGADRVFVVPNGVDPELVSADAERAGLREHLGLEANTFVVIYAGAHGMSNDLGMVLEAARQVQDQEQVAFVLIGAGKEKPRLQSRAAELNLTQVFFHPPVPKNVIAGYLVEANAGLAVLRDIPGYRMTYPNKVFDYMAAGLPVFCMIDGVIREVVETARAGVYIQPGDPAALADAVRKWAAEPLELARMGQSGREYVGEHFNREILAERMLGIMQSIVDGGENADDKRAKVAG